MTPTCVTPICEPAVLVLVVDDEGHHQVDLVFRDGTIFDADLLFFDLGATYVAQRLVCSGDAVDGGILKALGRDGADF